ncbi:MAG: type I restriction-modification system subunit M [Anaerovoracaceae bacterium]
MWALANELRGSVDGWDFKQYVLGMLFYRYISENFAAYLNKGEHDAGNLGFDYATLGKDDAETVREDMVKTKGFFILPEQLFCNLLKRIEQADKNAKEKALKEGKEVEIADLDENLNEVLQENFKSIEGSAMGTPSEPNFKGLFDDIDVNSNKLGPTVIKRNKRLKKLISVIGSLKLGDYQDNCIDAFGDAYEYLMGMYASNAGKSGGEFFTPQEVSELLARLSLLDHNGEMKKEVNKVYDPAVGSGSLLLKFAKILGKENVRNGFFGQEINITTYNLCRINMFLHDIGYEKFSIEHGDTLTDPQHWEDEPFEAIVSNPPYSIKWEGDDNGTLINDPRFSPAGVLAPKSKADFAFIMHSLSWLATSGTAAIVCFPGIMYRGGAEQKIRKYLIDNNYIECIIQLPDNLFYGTSIATCIMVLKKSKVDNQTLFIDASKECVKATNSNKLSIEGEHSNMENILSAYKQRATIQYFTQLVKKEDIEKADYNLSVSTYVESKDTREVIDITVLNAKINKIVERENALRTKIDAIIAEIEGVQR